MDYSERTIIIRENWIRAEGMLPHKTLDSLSSLKSQ